MPSNVEPPSRAEQADQRQPSSPRRVQTNHPDHCDSAPSGASSKENSPTKSKAKRRSEARKRANNQKKQHLKQQQQQKEQPPQQQPQEDNPNVTDNDNGQPIEPPKLQVKLEEHEPQSTESNFPADIAQQIAQEQNTAIATTEGAPPKSENNQSQNDREFTESNQPILDKNRQQEQENTPQKHQHNFNHQAEKLLLKLRDKENQEKKLKHYVETQQAQMKLLSDKLKQQASKIGELESQLLQTTKAYNQVDKNLQQEIASRKRFELENTSLTQTLTRLKTQLATQEKNKLSNDELMRVVNATLMERETEISILKLRLTRLQTANRGQIKAASSVTSVKQQDDTKQSDPAQRFRDSGRSKSEFDRNSYLRSTMIADTVSSSTPRIEEVEDRDAQVWASIPVELTPSKRPHLLEKNFNAIYGDYPHAGPSPLARDRRYKTLPRSMKSPPVSIDAKKNDTSEPSNSCCITNLDDSNNSANETSGNIDRKIPEMHSGQPSQINKTPDLIYNRNDNNNINNLKSKNLDTNPGEGLSNPAFNDSPFNEQPSKIQNLNLITPNLDNSGQSSTALSNESSRRGATMKPTASDGGPESLSTPTTPSRISGLMKIFGKFRRSDSTGKHSANGSSNESESIPNSPIIKPQSSPFKRSKNRSTLVGLPTQMSPLRRQEISFKTDKPFAEWDTEMLVEWLTTIGLSMYTGQCRKWAKCGAHIMNATPAEVDKGLGITNHLHRKKLRLAISELNGDCDKVTKASAKLDYLWVARWLDDIGLPQYKDTFIEARIDGRVLNYLTVEDLLSMGIKSILHHASIKSGIRVLRSINFDLTLLKRRATEDEIDQINSTRQQLSYQVVDMKTDRLSMKQQSSSSHSSIHTDLPLWTCHRFMEWLRLIDFAEFAPNLRGSGVHGGIIVYEDGFNFDTMCSLLSIPTSRTLLRRHLSTFLDSLIGKELAEKKKLAKETSSVVQLNPLDEIKSSRKSTLWFSRLKSSKVGQDSSGVDEYLCPMYPVEQLQAIQNRNSTCNSATISSLRETPHLEKIPESINV